ncbi:MAG TPA: GFA family protein [Candidatus Nanoarchaeia archaeon]|nr:GFA family protein [Candidatus Nanoarchaeia archaeon]
MKTYTGGCHCGKVRYEVIMDLKGGMACNCSHCNKKGFMLSFVPENQFKLLSGEKDLTEYRFNKKVIQHLFCKTCGVQSFGRGKGPDGSPVAMINLRCLDNVDLSKLPTTEYNGKDM